MLLPDLLATLAEHGISVIYIEKFSGVSSELTTSAEFECNDGLTEKGSLHIGADEILSRDRDHAATSAVPDHTGIISFGFNTQIRNLCLRSVQIDCLASFGEQYSFSIAIFGKHEVFPMSDPENLLVDTNAFTQINLNRTERLYKTLGWGEVNIIDMDLRLGEGCQGS